MFIKFKKFKRNRTSVFFVMSAIPKIMVLRKTVFRLINDRKTLKVFVNEKIALAHSFSILFT